MRWCFTQSLLFVPHVSHCPTGFLSLPTSSLECCLWEIGPFLACCLKVKVTVLVAQPCPTLCNSMNCNLPGSSVYGILQARILEWIAVPFSRGSSQPRIEPRSHIAGGLQVDSWPSEPPGKLKNIGVGNLSLLQGIFPTQGLNWGLLHCRRILYQLNYQGSLIT